MKTEKVRKEEKIILILIYEYYRLYFQPRRYISTYGYLVGDILTAVMVGFLMQGIFPIMYGFCGELVYPEPESTSTALNLICKLKIKCLILNVP